MPSSPVFLFDKKKKSRVSALALIAAVTPLFLAGCAGGSVHRDPEAPQLAERSHWIFPLYHYQEKKGRKTFTPLFLLPIPVGTTDAAIAQSDEPSFDEDSPLLNAEDTPAWGAEETWTVAATPPVDEIRFDPVPSSPPVYDTSATFGGPGTTHVIRAGDTLYTLARLHYGSGKEWPRIAAANRDRISGPNELPIGLELVIPQ